MAGSAIEYTMANVSHDNNLNLSNTMFNGIPISSDDYDLYGDNTFILGDATKEILNGNIITGNDDNNWIIRGNITSQDIDQMFSYTLSNEISSGSIGTRMTIK